MKKYAIFLLMGALAFVSCRSVDTFDASISGFEEKASRGVPAFHGLTLDPPSSEGGRLAIMYTKCEGFQKSSDTCTVLSTADKAAGIQRAVNIVAGDRMLSAADLRIGQQVVVNYALRGDLEPQNIEIRNYTPPTRFLRLTFAKGLMGDEKEDAEAVKSLLITHLSWRLPVDVGILHGEDIAWNNAMIGDIQVQYRRFQESTQWIMRSRKTREILNITTLLADPNSSTNWAKLEAFGGSEPLGHDAFSYSFKSAMIEIPMFEISPVAVR